jgi:hypothetical protein
MRQFFDTIYARKSKITQFSQDMVNGAANLSPLFINGELIMKTTILAAAAVLVPSQRQQWLGKAKSSLVTTAFGFLRKLKHTRNCTLQLTLSGSTVVANW